MNIKASTPCYWLNENGEEHGPTEWKNIRFSIQSNSISSNTLIMPEGATQWKAAYHYIDNTPAESKDKSTPKTSYLKKHSRCVIIILAMLLTPFICYKCAIYNHNKAPAQSTTPDYNTNLYSSKAEQKCRVAARVWLRNNLKDQDAEIKKMTFLADLPYTDDITAHCVTAIVHAKNSYGVKLRRSFIFYLDRGDYSIIYANTN